MISIIHGLHKEQGKWCLMDALLRRGQNPKGAEVGVTMTSTWIRAAISLPSHSFGGSVNTEGLIFY